MLSLHKLSLFFIAGTLGFAQYPGMTLPTSGNNQKAAVTQYMGPVRVSIQYSSPAVHDASGKDRRGHIWGELVPYGMSNLGFGNGKPGPWRAGANENTVFEVSNDILVEGKKLAAGRYGLHMIPGAEEWVIIFNKNAGAWGSFWYEESDDALRVTVRPHKHEYREYLTYEFEDRRPDSASAELQWEELAVPWKMKVDNVNQIYISRLKQELTTVPGFDFHGYMQAARFTVQSKTDLEQGLKWADAAISLPGIGVANFNTLSTKAQVLAAMGRQSEAENVMQEALHNPSTTPLEIHQYGRLLIARKKYKEAMEVFQYSAQRNGDAWPVHVGLARGYSANGDNQKALEHARKALTQAPDPLNKKGLEDMIAALEAGKSIAQ